MVWRCFCDDCGSEKEVAHLTISAEVSRGGDNDPLEMLNEEAERRREAGETWPDGSQGVDDHLLAYDRDLCSSCRHVRIRGFLDFLEKLKRRR